MPFQVRNGFKLAAEVRFFATVRALPRIFLFAVIPNALVSATRARLDDVSEAQVVSLLQRSLSER